MGFAHRRRLLRTVAWLEWGLIHLARLGECHVHHRSDMDSQANSASLAEATSSAEANGEAVHTSATS